MRTHSFVLDWRGGRSHDASRSKFSIGRCLEEQDMAIDEPKLNVSMEYFVDLIFKARP
jgi:hypothetical protein